ncbi:MAG: NTP transferase domain-containing protein [Oscillospiraceae bacterium]
MKAILLATGRGTRISRMVEAVPKSTLPIDGVPLIRHTVELFTSTGIECVVGVGYQKEKVYAALEGLNVSFCVNPFFDVTNSIASLWFAKEHFNDDMIVMNADVYLSSDILKLVLDDPNDVVMAIDKSRVEVGDYFFATTDNGCITAYGKELPLENRTCEYVGVCKMTKSFVPAFLDRMDSLILDNQHGLWWENVIYSFTNERNIYTVDVDGRFWSEIDYFDDYERILRHIEKERSLV